MVTVHVISEKGVFGNGRERSLLRVVSVEKLSGWPQARSRLLMLENITEV